MKSLPTLLSICAFFSYATVLSAQTYGNIQLLNEPYEYSCFIGGHGAFSRWVGNASDSVGKTIDPNQTAYGFAIELIPHVRPFEKSSLRYKFTTINAKVNAAIITLNRPMPDFSPRRLLFSTEDAFALLNIRKSWAWRPPAATFMNSFNPFVQAAVARYNLQNPNDSAAFLHIMPKLGCSYWLTSNLGELGYFGIGVSVYGGLGHIYEDDGHEGAFERSIGYGDIGNTFYRFGGKFNLQFRQMIFALEGVYNQSTKGEFTVPDFIRNRMYLNVEFSVIGNILEMKRRF